MSLYIMIQREDGRYLSPDDEWVTDPGDAAAYVSRHAAEEDAADLQKHNVSVVELEYSDDTPPAGREWDQARNCWADEVDRNADIASIVDGAVGTIPHHR